MNPLHTISDVLRLPLSTPLWFANLLFWSIQVALLVAIAALLPRLFQIRQPRVLLAYWRALLLICFALPVVQPWHHPRIIRAFVLIESPTAVLPPPSPTATSHWQLPGVELLAQVVAILILCGIAVRLVLFTLGLLRLRQFRRASRPFPPSVGYSAVLEQVLGHLIARAQFRLSAALESPVTFGFAAPLVLFPERFLSLEPRFQTAIACHELLHVRRRDWAHHLSEEVLRAAFWFHPAIAWLISRVRLAREQVVDLEVVRLTGARKTYLEALLQFAGTRAQLAAMPAPLFLAERQFVERVALMLKEVRMSRQKLIASFAVITCCLALAVILGVWTFPLRGAPLVAQAPQTGVTGGVSGGIADGVSGDVSGGVSGGIAGEVAKAQSGSEPTVAYNTIWVDTVKRGPMVRQVRGLGTLVHAEGSANWIARISLPEVISKDVSTGESAAVSTQAGPVAKGRVSSIGREVINGTVSVDIALDGTVSKGAAEGLQVDGTIEIEKLENVLQIGRPIHVAADSTSPVFKIVKDGTAAERVNVKFGRASVQTIEILDGLQPGDKIILSDMSPYNNADRVRLTNDKNPG